MEAEPENQPIWSAEDKLGEGIQPPISQGVVGPLVGGVRRADAICVAILILACALRFFAYYEINYEDLSRPPVMGNGDQIDLFRIAHAIAHGRGFSRDDSPELTQLFQNYQTKEGAVPYSEDEIDALSKRGLLDDEYPDRPDRTAYRDILYPYVASIFADASDPFLALRLLNFFLVCFNALLIFFVAKRIGVGHTLSVLCAGLYLVHPYTPLHASLLMTETLATSVVAGLVLVCLQIDDSRSLRTCVLLGIGVGLLILAKKQFLLLLPVYALIFLAGFWRKDFTLRQGAVAAVTTLIVSLPLFINSWQVTHDLVFITGTNGWNDMPAAYSRELARSGMSDFYKIRTASFDYYRAQTGRTIKGELEMARAGKELFHYMLREDGFVARIPRLVVLKLVNEIFPGKNLYILALIVASLAGFALTLRRYSSQLCLAILLSCMLAVALTHGGYGRMLFSTVIVQCVGVALLLKVQLIRAGD
ncbi:MAG: glycosyltransferase family 39 protein [Myxococcales bacterium]|nr:glycosyltransferase family 39 protein [Myxococcales bacterium]